MRSLRRSRYAVTCWPVGPLPGPLLPAIRHQPGHPADSGAGRSRRLPDGGRLRRRPARLHRSRRRRGRGDECRPSARPGSIVSMHFGHPGTVAAFPQIVTNLRAHGLSTGLVRTVLGLTPGNAARPFSHPMRAGKDMGPTRYSSTAATSWSRPCSTVSTTCSSWPRKKCSDQCSVSSRSAGESKAHLARE